ncbi:MAG TPA: ABC transporter permease [Candidatus Sumerlaeota bacterium]|nr:ABC transporter permease [Candidatus Sumerlaeota bacterium]
MARYILRRFLYSLTLVAGVMLILFLLYNVLGGSNKAVLRIAGRHATPEEIQNIRRQYGFDQPYPAQLAMLVRQCLTFEFGRSLNTRQKVSIMLRRGAVPSLILMAPAFFATVILAIIISLYCAWRRNSLADRVILILSVAGMSVSIMAYIILGQYLLAYRWRLFPISGYESDLRALRYIILPGIIYVLVALGAEVRLYRTFMLNEVNQDYVRTARAKGLSMSRVLFRHVLPNAMIPIITQVVIAVPFLIMGSLLLESFFSIPGLGSMSMDALNTWDFPVLKAITFLGALMYIAGNLLSDVLYAIVDPRVKLS